MKKSITVGRKIRGRPATGTDPQYAVRLSQEFVEQIDRWAKANDTTRSGAMRMLMELGLKGKK